MTRASNIEACFKLAYPAFSLDVDLKLPGHGVTALFGHSGSGKSTLLRCLAGLERAEGRLLINGEFWQDSRYFMPTHKRPLGYVFQDANLFPHLNVMGNLKFGIRRESKSSGHIPLDQAIELLGIGHLLARRPDRLSGGERQRVAIARALAVNPRILLMDEPLAALDLARKREILPFLEKLREELDIPLIYVTHSPDEVARLADHLVVMDNGRAIASGPLNETLARTDLPIQLSEEAGVVFEAIVTERDPDWHLARADFAGGSMWIRDMNFEPGKPVRFRVLARDVSLALIPGQQGSIVNQVPGVIKAITEGEHPSLKLAQLQVGESFLLCRLTARSLHGLGVDVGSQVWAQIKSAAIIE